MASVKTLRLRQNGRHFPDDIYKCIFLNENIWISFKNHWRLFLGVSLTIFQHWLRYWLYTDHVTGHYLNQWWLVYWRIYESCCLNDLRSINPNFGTDREEDKMYVWDKFSDSRSNLRENCDMDRRTDVMTQRQTDLCNENTHSHRRW